MIDPFVQNLEVSMRALIALPLAVFLQTPARAAPGTIPAVVSARIAEDKAACGDRAATIEPGFLTIKDVNGGGKPDYVLDYRHLLCGSMPGFCGSGGCTSVVYASRGGTYAKAFEDLVGRVSFKTIDGRPAMLVVQRHGSSTLFWNGSTFASPR